MTTTKAHTLLLRAEREANDALIALGRALDALSLAQSTGDLERTLQRATRRTQEAKTAVCAVAQRLLDLKAALR